MVGEEKKEVRCQGGFGFRQRGRSKCQRIAESARVRVIMRSSPLLHNEIKCQWENRNQSRWFNVEPTQIHSIPHAQSPQITAGDG